MKRASKNRESKRAERREREALEREGTAIGETADRVLMGLLAKKKGAGFGVVHNQAGEPAGIVMVCIDPKQIDTVKKFTENLGGFWSRDVLETPNAG